MTFGDAQSEISQTAPSDATASGAKQTTIDDIPALVRRLSAAIHQATIGLSSGKANAIIDANELLAVAALHAHSVAAVAVKGLEQASEFSHVDSLTGLPNRVLFRDRCAQAIANGKRHNARVAVLFVDLDGFKAINDKHGHAIGDELLRHASQCLRDAGREVDTVYRHGGDEFVILLSDATDPEAAIRYAEKALTALNLPLSIGEHMLRIGASIGIALFPEDGHTPEILIRAADAAMYDAKRTQSRISYASTTPGRTAAYTPRNAATAADPLRLLERSLQDANALVVDLTTKNAALTAEIETSAQALRSAEGAKRHQAELLHIVAHELRNAMSPLQSASDVLRLMHDDPSLLHRLELILRRQITQMSRLLDDILDVSRINNGRSASTFEPVDMSSLVSDACIAMTKPLRRRGQAITLSVEPASLIVSGDQSRLRDVVTALFGYASEQMADGGTLDVSLLQRAGHVVLSFDYHDQRTEAEAEANTQTPPSTADTTVMIGAPGSFTFSLFVIIEFVKLHNGLVAMKRGREPSAARIEVCLPLS